MINELIVGNVASFTGSSQHLTDLRGCNYLYGANGSGKTTISRLVEDPDRFPSCTINWVRGVEMARVVYNTDFVERNFGQSSEMKGVFTLGEENKELAEKIEGAKRDIDELRRKIGDATKNLDGEEGTPGKRKELEELCEQFSESCWEVKSRHDEAFKGPFHGTRDSKNKFAEKVLKEFEDNSADVLDLDDLRRKVEDVFDENVKIESFLVMPDFTTLVELASNELLAQAIVGKEAVDISAMIERLGNADWIRAGKTFLKVDDQTCPFCQQTINEQFRIDLEQYFDESYERKIVEIKTLQASFSRSADAFLMGINNIIDAAPKQLNVDRAIAVKERIVADIERCNQVVSAKIGEPSRMFEMPNISEALIEFKVLIEEANRTITEHNAMVNDLAAQREKLTRQVWKYLLENDLKGTVTTFMTQKEAIGKAIAGLEKSRTESGTRCREKEVELRMLEEQTTSVQPTIDNINQLLDIFGFTGFHLAKAESELHYKIVRPDGSDAKPTLSEGEKTFVTYLYFHNLLRGSIEATGVVSDRIVVIDDPVSSLDSDVLFIVSSLIRELCDQVVGGKSNIKQVFVLTHNVYFYKEITFDPSWNKTPPNQVSFWVIKKQEGVSHAEKHEANPIKTSYQMLWDDVKDPAKAGGSIQNTMRRILEHYFSILGDLNFNSLSEKFEGPEKLACRSLFSWVNDGSHACLDDLYVSGSEISQEVYLRVFRQIFVESKHEAHYLMMIGEGLPLQASAALDVKNVENK